MRKAAKELSEHRDDVRRQPLPLERTAKFILWETAVFYVTVCSCIRRLWCFSLWQKWITFLKCKNKWQSSIKAIFHNGKIISNCAKKAQMGNKGDETNFLGILSICASFVILKGLVRSCFFEVGILRSILFFSWTYRSWIFFWVPFCRAIKCSYFKLLWILKGAPTVEDHFAPSHLWLLHSPLSADALPQATSPNYLALGLAIRDAPAVAFLVASERAEGVSPRDTVPWRMVCRSLMIWTTDRLLEGKLVFSHRQ